MMRAPLAALALLLTACQTPDPVGLLRNLAAPGDGEMYRQEFGPGDSAPFRVQGGDYDLVLFPVKDCGQAITGSVRRLQDRREVMAVTGAPDGVVSRTITALPAGLYLLSATIGTTSCPLEFNLFTAK